MSKILQGLNPFGIHTGCFNANKSPHVFLGDVFVIYEEQTDEPLSLIIKNSWENHFNNKSFVESIKDTYKALVGNHKSLATNNHYYNSANGKTFKGLLDCLIIPLVARQLLNWSILKFGRKNSFFMELVISAVRTFSLAVLVVKILIGIALTIALTPIVGLICLLRKPNNSTSEEIDLNNDEDKYMENDFGI